MSNLVATDPVVQQYLAQYAEPGLPDASDRTPPCRQVIVLPAYREAANCIDHLLQDIDTTSCLVILVLNRPDTDLDHDANAALRERVAKLPTLDTDLYRLSRGGALYVLELEALRGPTPLRNGVGLARKMGSDLALKWMADGVIDGHWIISADADARLPADLFSRLDGLAGAGAALPFVHTPADEAVTRASALYELRLHQYVLGLERAHSPYAFHTLGSCMVLDAECYARVRGIPRRAAGEDFYVLNKLAKQRAIARPGGDCIRLASRVSDRVPFGTGPAVSTLLSEKALEDAALFYDPRCYDALGAALQLGNDSTPLTPEAWREQLVGEGLESGLAGACAAVLETLGLQDALAHCHRQARGPAAFARHFHQWLDGFRSLKLIHGIREAGYPMLTLRQLDPRWEWPGATGGTDTEVLRAACRTHWGWQADG